MRQVRRLRSDSIPVVGFTWYGLVDMTDWDIALRERRGTVNPVGLFDLNRQERPVARAYRTLVRDYGHVQAWDTALTQSRGTVNKVGLYTLGRKPRKVAREYRRLVEEYSHLPISSTKMPILTA